MKALDGVSVIICCYNSVARIAPTLEYISRQRLKENIGLEVILVDNASDDATPQVAQQAWKTFNINHIEFKVVTEPNPGLNYARKRGVIATKYPYLVFCDDDNWLDQDYITTVYLFFNEHPQIAIAGGYGKPTFDKESRIPDWFDRFQASYALGPQAAGSTINTTSVYGAGMAARKEIFQSGLAESPLLLAGRKRQNLSSGEDSEMCFRIRLMGYQIAYLQQLKFQHYIPNERLSWSYLKKLHEGLANSFVVLDLYQTALRHDRAQLSALYWLKMLLYYWGIYLKYWWSHHTAYNGSEGTIEEIRHITWKVIAKSYWNYNFKTLKLYHIILTFTN